MSMMKRFAEKVSEAMGLCGEINDEVLAEADRLLHNPEVNIGMYSGTLTIRVEGGHGIREHIAALLEDVLDLGQCQECGRYWRRDLLTEGRSDGRDVFCPDCE